MVSEGIGSFEVINLLAILARAVSCGRAEMVRSLMSLLSQEDSHDIAKFRDASGMGLLHLAVRSGSPCILETLLEECSADDWQVSANWFMWSCSHDTCGAICSADTADVLPGIRTLSFSLCTLEGNPSCFAPGT